jgi:2-methylcitrate dehydratase PrpD
MDLICKLVNHVLKIRYEDLSSHVIEVVKKTLIDTLGCTIAGSTATGCPELVELVKDWGGKPEATVLVYGGKVPAPAAALTNCTMARALDFDDVHEMGGGHLSATFFPVCLILSEYRKEPVNGRDFILASTLGADLSCRLRYATKIYPGWLAETVAPFGIVAAAGKLLGFDEEKLINGMGIAYSQCSCNLQPELDGGITIRLQQGLGARAGILATMLAEKGFTGARNVLQGVYGFYPLYYRDKYDPEVITKNLGRDFEVGNISIKLYPTNKQNHNAISGILEFRKETGIEPWDIDEIVVYTNQKAYHTAGLGESKYHPRNSVDAQFSIPYTVANALIKGDVFIEDFTEEAIKNNEVLELAQRIKVKVDPELDKIPWIIVPNKIEIKVKGGRQYSKYVEYAKGHPKNPIPITEYIEKFKKCIPFSAKPIAEGNVEKVIDMIERLEEMEDVREIIKLLS